jgi:hypothetical protein
LKKIAGEIKQDLYVSLFEARPLADLVVAAELIAAEQIAGSKTR